MADNPELRKLLAMGVNSVPQTRAELETNHGKGNVFDTTELGEHFEVIGFAAPFVSVVRKSDGKKGSLLFQHSPRYYFDFIEV
jgi:hypothetical protein